MEGFILVIGIVTALLINMFDKSFFVKAGGLLFIIELVIIFL